MLSFIRKKEEEYSCEHVNACTFKRRLVGAVTMSRCLQKSERDICVCEHRPLLRSEVGSGPVSAGTCGGQSRVLCVGEQTCTEDIGHWSAGAGRDKVRLWT